MPVKTDPKTKAAEDRRTYKRFASVQRHMYSARFWSAAVLCRFSNDLVLTGTLVAPRPGSALDEIPERAYQNIMAPWSYAPQTRREFLADVGRGMLVATVGAGVARELSLAPAFAADAPDNL